MADIVLQKIKRFNQKINRMQYIYPDDFFKDYRYLNSKEFKKAKRWSMLGLCFISN